VFRALGQVLIALAFVAALASATHFGQRDEAVVGLILPTADAMWRWVEPRLGLSPPADVVASLELTSLFALVFCALVAWSIGAKLERR
jgi:hypothetical protein